MSTRESKKRRSPNWTDNEVNVLLDLWKENRKQLESSKRNNSLYVEMSTEMAGYYCYRSAEEIKTKIDNMAKRFKYERTQEILNGTKSEWKFYWQVDDILGLNPSYCVEYIKDNINKKTEDHKKNNQATILMFKYPNKKDVEEDEEQIEDMESDQSQKHSEPKDNFPLSLPAAETNYESDSGNENVLKDLIQEYKETKECLVETDKKILELISSQNDLIKTQNELCQTQNAILKTLLDKMA